MSDFRPDGALPFRREAPRLGRVREHEQLRQWLADALGGSPRVVLVTGEAGIGKSNLVADLIADARDLGVRPFAGRSLEDSQVPLLPLASVLDTLLPDLGKYRPDTTDVARNAPVLVTDTARALMAAAVDRPILLVLEDAQWADQATIEMISHIAATLAHEAVFRQLAVMLVVTARTSGVRPAAQRLLSRLARETNARSLTLVGFDELDLYGVVAARTGGRPSSSLLAFVRDATSGNPLEIDSLLTRLEAAGALVRQDDEITTTVRDVSTLPLDVDIDAEAQLGALSDDARRLVVTIALLRDGRMGVLHAAVGLARERFDAALDELIDAGLVRDDGSRVDFVDPALQRAAARGMSGRRRQRTHAEIARRLADASDPTIAVTEIVDQLHRAGREADHNLLTQLAPAAGEEALTKGAWTDAVRHFEAALESDSLTDVDRARLELRAARAAHRENDTRNSARHATQAIEVAGRAGDFRTWGEAALLQGRAAWTTEPLERFVAEAGDHEPGLRAQAHGVLAEIAFERFDRERARAEATEAGRIARELKDPRVAARVEFGVGLQALGALDFDVADRHFERCNTLAHRADDQLAENWSVGRRALVQFCRGRLGTASGLAARAADRSRAAGWWAEYALMSATRASIALAQGNAGAAERFVAEATAAHARTERRGQAGMLWSTAVCTRALIGDVSGAHAVLDAWEQEDARAAFLYRALVDAVVGEGPNERTTAIPDSLVRPQTSVDLPSLSVAAIAVELGDFLDRPALAERALPILTEAYERGARFTAGWCSFVPRLAGVACHLTGDPTAADTWLRTASLEAARCGSYAEVARCHYDQARVQRELGATDEADELLEVAIVELDGFGYRPLFRAARRLAGRPEIASGPPPSARVIMVTDLVDSTPLTQRVGNQRFLELLREHNRIVRTRLRQFDGVEFKHTGDGVAVWFLTVGSAVECATRIQRDMDQYNAARVEYPLVIRIGISSGEVVTEGNDLFGLAVVTAFRVCDHAPDGGILVSDEIPPLVRDMMVDVTFEAFGDVALKGITDVRHLFEVVTKDS